jgi:L-serine dehydratase
MGVFDIIGPIMIGPSSSHTAGAVRLGKMARNILGDTPMEATMTLHGSFARTYKGHGTDKALVAGLLGFSTDDPRIKNSLEVAANSGLKTTFLTEIGGEEHPNTVEIKMKGASGDIVTVIGVSIGGGNIVIKRINNYQVEITGNHFTLLIANQDKPGVIAAVCQILAQEDLNIASMRVSRYHRGEQALMILELDQPASEQTLTSIQILPSIERALLLPPL